MDATAKEIIKNFYDSAAKKSDKWQENLADEVSFSVASEKKFAGKETFIRTYTAVLQAVEEMDVKQLITGGDTVCAIVSYDYISPMKARLHQEVAEVWKVVDGKIASFTLYYDEGEYRSFIGK
ncbi:MAG TPA: nuclear transport factor 2 family protein [Candidatus Chromulinivoraceae bacterium]|nr:nuclear transport factor 2 family protein [Candidatus Chromulinivoraceae bacterium]